jgi:hypothetical protein
MPKDDQMSVPPEFREIARRERSGFKKAKDFSESCKGCVGNAALQEPTGVARVVGTPNWRTFS